jgi:hypothetical protein
METKKLQVVIPQTLNEAMEQELKQLSMVTGIDLSVAKFAAQTLKNQWKVEFERLQKSLKNYTKEI